MIIITPRDESLSPVFCRGKDRVPFNRVLREATAGFLVVSVSLHTASLIPMIWVNAVQGSVLLLFFV